MQWNGAGRTDRITLVEAKMLDGHAQHALAHFKTTAGGLQHHADHLVQRLADVRCELGIIPVKKRQIGAAEAGQLRLEHDLLTGIRIPLGLGHLHQAYLSRSIEVTR